MHQRPGVHFPKPWQRVLPARQDDRLGYDPQSLTEDPCLRFAGIDRNDTPSIMEAPRGLSRQSH